ncbi:MAG: glucose-1-phosphate adenylyltransferase subunit GlgD [Clostridia bacterium]|jgi:glucose-1-phosphate adenylyltransferase|nr:glucose-1-phosphate adenylyltransferase subunit GlgD [Clostridia bacterium]
MMPKNVLGIVYSNSYDACLEALTARRTMGSVPFGGRYRLIDFPLSNMVNCGITKVGVIANSNFRSLMDHIGSGRPWDLSRKVDGLTMLPPFTPTTADSSNRIDSLYRIMDFISHSKQEYVLLMDANFVCNMDLSKLFDFHSKKNADITMGYCYGQLPKLQNQAVIEVDGDSKITSVGIDVKTASDVSYIANVVLIRKALLERLIGDAQSYAYTSFEKDIIQKNVNTLNIYGYKIEEWNCTIDSMNTYFAANMELLEKSARKALFKSDSPVYTKVRDDMPVVYGVSSSCKNSLIADGCLIEGTVKNSIIFRGARVAKGAVVENSILMQDAFVGEDAKLNCVVMDKNTVITPKKVLSGDKNYPLFVGKEIVI